MKIRLIVPIVASCWFALSLPAQESPRATTVSPDGRAILSPTGATGDYASDVGVVLDAQGQALERARRILDGGGNARDRAPLEAAIKEMERSRTALEQARKLPEKLPAAIAAEQAAYQALLKATPREYRMTRSRNRDQSGNSSGQPSQQELDQLELNKEENRYETERQATATPTQKQREQTQTVDRLKQLARRQQDLNDRLRDLQTALQEAHTDQEREEIQRQLKRLRDEERQVLSDVDELRQRLEQSPDAAAQPDARQQLERTRSDVQRAAQELERQSVSEALAAGSRAEQKLQNLRENLRQQTSSQFAEQMRQMRSQARDLANQESQIARDLDALNNSAQKLLDDSPQRQSLVERMTRQQSALTNLLGEMRAVTEQAESTEPLLSKQLYDILRRADQLHTDNQLEMGGRLVDRGFLPQASEAERSARQNIDELRQSVDRAAESVLGSETEALRYAQRELDDLAGQMAKEMSAQTNATASAAEAGSRGQGQTNSPATGGDRAAKRPGNGRAGTNAIAGAASDAGEENGQARSAQSSSPNPQNAGREVGATQGNKQGNASQAQRPGNPSAGQNTASGEDQAPAGGGGDSAGRERLRQFAQQLGGGGGRLGENGPITGNNYMDWSDRMRDVEQTVDSQNVRNQLATVRERVGVYRRSYRQNGRLPSSEELQTKVLAPLALARDWVGQELSRAQNDRSLVPLDRDLVQEKYSDLVRKYYEKLGSPQ
jgi:hypothetical protein